MNLSINLFQFKGKINNNLRGDMAYTLGLLFAFLLSLNDYCLVFYIRAVLCEYISNLK